MILAFRDYSIGIDLKNYKSIFDLCTNSSWQTILQNNYDVEIGYIILNKVVSYFGDFRLLLIIIAAISTYFFYKLYNKNDQFQYLRIVLFSTVTVFSMIFSGLRQTIAISIGIFAFYFTKENKPFLFLFSVVLACFFHASAIVLIFMYPTYYLKITKNKLYFLLPFLLLVFIFNRQIFSFVLRFMGERYIERYSLTTATGAYSMLVLYLLFLLYSYIIPFEVNKELNGLRNMMIIIVIIQMFAPVHNLAMRMNYYYIIFIPLLIPEIFYFARIKYKKICILSYFVMCIFFTIYFFYNGYTGDDILNIFPYLPFWEGGI